MVKHILGQAFLQCLVLFISMFAGEFFIVEPNIKYRYDKPDSKYIYPGRYQTWSGEPMYSKYALDGASRHYTWIFTTFVIMQICNMFPARKIHDEWNIFDGVNKNLAFMLIFVLIAGMQVIITQLGSVVMIVSKDGLSGA